MNNLSCTHPQFVPNLMTFFFLVQQKRSFLFREFWTPLVFTVRKNWSSEHLLVSQNKVRFGVTFLYRIAVDCNSLSNPLWDLRALRSPIQRDFTDLTSYNKSLSLIYLRQHKTAQKIFSFLISFNMVNFNWTLTYWRVSVLGKFPVTQCQYRPVLSPCLHSGLGNEFFHDKIIKFPFSPHWTLIRHRIRRETFWNPSTAACCPS